MRESVRAIHRKTLRETRAPQSGAYYWIPNPSSDSIKWDVLEFYDEHHNDNTLHMDMWDGVLELLAIRWHKDINHLKQHLSNNYTALPRGRVNRVPGESVPGWTLVHGNDAPGTIQSVLAAFNLTAIVDKVKILFDEHEQMDTNDCEQLQKVLGIDLGLVGIDFRS